MHNFKTLKQIDVKKKRALLRADLNVPEEDIWRIEAVIPTLKYLIKQKAKIILISHLGRPKGRKNNKLSLRPIAEELSKLLRKKILFSEQIIGWSVQKKIERMKFGDILMLENIRFYSGEEKNSPRLAKELAGLGDVFINDAFAASHRKHVSIIGIPEFLPSGLGFLFEKEINELSKIFKKTKRPLIAVIGGAKISTKTKLINQLLLIADKVLIGGALPNTIFASQGISIGESAIDRESFLDIKDINLQNPKLFLPIDLATWDSENVFYREINEIGKKEKILDMGPKTIDLFCNIVKEAKIIIWNGPLGLVEQEPFDRASIEMVGAIEKSKAYSIVGGGDTVAFIRKIRKENVFDHISTGGGAMLDYLTNETLPGLLALEK